MAMHERAPRAAVTQVVAAPVGSADPRDEDSDAPTVLWAHNVRLRQGASFKVSIRWIRGLMVRTRAKVHASFDDPDSFVLEIDKGVVRVALADIVAFLNSGDNRGVPLQGISIVADGETLKVHGTVHRIDAHAGGAGWWVNAAAGWAGEVECVEDRCAEDSAEGIAG